jgi:hypothetical protein
MKCEKSVQGRFVRDNGKKSKYELDLVGVQEVAGKRVQPNLLENMLFFFLWKGK